MKINLDNILNTFFESLTRTAIQYRDGKYRNI